MIKHSIIYYHYLFQRGDGVYLDSPHLLVRHICQSSFDEYENSMSQLKITGIREEKLFTYIHTTKWFGVNCLHYHNEEYIVFLSADKDITLRAIDMYKNVRPTIHVRPYHYHATI